MQLSSLNSTVKSHCKKLKGWATFQSFELLNVGGIGGTWLYYRIPLSNSLKDKFDKASRRSTKFFAQNYKTLIYYIIFIASNWCHTCLISN